METAVSQILSNIQTASAGLLPILYGLGVAAGLDTLTGVWAAWKSGTFNATFLPQFISSHIVQRITPILLVLLAGISVGGTDSGAGQLLVVLGGSAGAAYLAAVVASITDNIQQGFEGTKGVPSGVAPTATTFALTPLTDNASPDE